MNHEDITIEIRRAKADDVASLSLLHRQGFPELLGYQLPTYYLKKWWDFLITFRDVEVYVVSLKGNIVGSATLIINPEEYFREKERHRPHLLVFIYSIIVNPKLLINYFRKSMHKYAIPHSKSSSNSANQVDNTTWIDPIVTSSLCQGRGVAKKLLIYLEERTLRMNRNIIALIVDFKNTSAVSLYESAGYIQYARNNEGYLFYKKFLNSL